MEFPDVNGCFSLMAAGANGGEVSGGTTGTRAWKDHPLATFCQGKNMGIPGSSSNMKKRILQTLACLKLVTSLTLKEKHLNS